MIESISTESDYRTALERLSNLLGAAPGTPEDKELDALATLIERYEEQHYLIMPRSSVMTKDQIAHTLLRWRKPDGTVVDWTCGYEGDVLIAPTWALNRPN